MGSTGPSEIRGQLPIEVLTARIGTLICAMSYIMYWKTHEMQGAAPLPAGAQGSAGASEGAVEPFRTATWPWRQHAHSSMANTIILAILSLAIQFGC